MKAPSSFYLGQGFWRYNCVFSNQPKVVIIARTFLRPYLQSTRLTQCPCSHARGCMTMRLFNFGIVWRALQQTSFVYDCLTFAVSFEIGQWIYDR
ncbi:hypothetical protein BDN70DRAFT_235767 [Pholiota conissans]|uniref:Uncharacterized protein n=1 Tax=Pholiota conissans TaxID=109636 RepID=A0A9P6D7U2_9AGAR|nr:hypothetical protein BDN70DRAFT_235767 [Pholiota conissans]